MREEERQTLTRNTIAILSNRLSLSLCLPLRFPFLFTLPLLSGSLILLLSLLNFVFAFSFSSFFPLLWKFSVAHWKCNSCGWRDRINQSVNQSTDACCATDCLFPSFLSLSIQTPESMVRIVFFLVLLFLFMLTSKVYYSFVGTNEFIPDHCFLWRLFVIYAELFVGVEQISSHDRTEGHSFFV